MVGLNINIKSNIKEVVGKFKKLPMAMEKALDQSLLNTAMQGSAFASAIAPRKSGALAASIRFSKVKNGYAVISGQPRGENRPYHLWWHSIGGYDLTKTAQERGWKLTGMASTMGYPDNQYMYAAGKYMAEISMIDAPKRLDNAIRVTLG